MFYRRHNTYFITIMKDDYEIDLITWGRVSITDNTNEYFKKAQILNIPHTRYYNLKFNLGMKSMIEKEIY